MHSWHVGCWLVLFNSLTGVKDCSGGRQILLDMLGSERVEAALQSCTVSGHPLLEMPMRAAMGTMNDLLF